ncbi:MAG: TIGR03862 family flavoprotein [Pseudomonadota bacterium]
MASSNSHIPSIIVIGGGPAGLMAAEVLVAGGARVDVYDAMPSVGRKFLMAGKGGLNLTHSEPFESFLSRYGARRDRIEPWLTALGPDALRSWVHELGVDTFVGTSGRVFPTSMKAAPMLRAWLHRLREAGVKFHMRHRWLGWDENGAVRISTPHGEQNLHPDAIVLALGGGSWARLGSDGAWVPLLMRRGVQITPLQPANCGFDTNWSEHFCLRFAGHPLKPVAITFVGSAGAEIRRQGEFVITASGVEGSLIYALSANLRNELEATGSAVIHIDLSPGWELQRVIDEVSRPRGSRSISSHLQSRLGLKGVKVALLRECLPAEDFKDPMRLGAAIKALPLRLIASRPIDEAISSAGGIAFDALDPRLMIRSLPGVFCAGEMLDWEAPTGGYLLTGCFASGIVAGRGALAWLAEQ